MGLDECESSIILSWTKAQTQTTNCPKTSIIYGIICSIYGLDSIKTRWKIPQKIVEGKDPVGLLHPNRKTNSNQSTSFSYRGNRQEKKSKKNAGGITIPYDRKIRKKEYEKLSEAESGKEDVENEGQSNHSRNRSTRECDH